MTDVPQLIAQVNGNATLHKQVLGAILNYTKTNSKLMCGMKTDRWRVNVTGLVEVYIS